MSRLVLFEDAVATRFLPLAWTRPVFDLRCGIFTLREAIERAYGRSVEGFYIRDYLTAVVRERSGLPVNETLEGTLLLLNGRLLASPLLPEALPPRGLPRRFVAPDGTLLAARVQGAVLRGGWEALHALPAETVDWPFLAWPWELLHHTGERIAIQARGWPLGQQPELLAVHLLNAPGIFVHPTAQLQPGVVLDATDGPIVLERDVTVMANAVIQGPAYIGPGSTIKIGAKIYHDTAIGPVCKVGGEVEASIFQGYSNKQHDGFLGHAYVGEWCNFGADTNNSDLKNNYGTVSVWSDGVMRDTGLRFVGLFMGDHSKTGINTMLNTGTVVGVSCNLFGGGLPPKVVPSFSWGGTEKWSTYRFDEALDTAERVMERRVVVLGEAERILLRHIYDATSDERSAFQEDSK